MRAVKKGESPQNTDVFVGALIPRAKVPEAMMSTRKFYEEEIDIPVAMTTLRYPDRYKLQQCVSEKLSSSSVQDSKYLSTSVL